MSTPFTPPSPAAIPSGGSVTPAVFISQIPQLPPPSVDASVPSASGSASSTSVVVVVIIIASAFIASASIYLLLRLLSRRFHRASRTYSAADDVIQRHNSFSNTNSSQQQQCHAVTAGLLDSLPLFTFGSVTGNLTGGDCAVCLSKFEPQDQLRLLPLCCHAFHAACIDTWIVSNQSCPLCRSTVLPSDSDVLGKILSVENRGGGNSSFRNGNSGSFRNGNSGSFRIEIGSISRRRGGSMEAAVGDRLAYSIGSFEYIVDENGYEISVGSTMHRRGASDCTSVDKESSIGISVPAPPGEALATEVSAGRNWLREYVDRLASISLSSRALSLRSSGRFFSGSSRRTETVPVAEDLEANQTVGEEISELFRWLSGV